MIENAEIPNTTPWAISDDHPSAFATEKEAEEAIDAIGGAWMASWFPELNQNPNARRAISDLAEAESGIESLPYEPGREPHPTDRIYDLLREIAALMSAQVRATLAVRDQLAGFRPSVVPDSAPQAAD